MAKTIFTMFSVNEHKPLVDANGKIEVITEIETDHDAKEANDINVELTEVANECSNAIDVNTELIQQEETNTELIENTPEQVTEEVVQVAQENFVYALGKLGLSKEELVKLRRNNATQFSMESDKSPLTKLKISNEGIKEFIEKLIQKVKDLFMKFFNLFKKFLLKIRKMMDVSLARAKVLLEKVNEKAKYKVEGDSLDYINSMFIGMQAIEGASGGGKLEIEKGNDAIKAMVSHFANASSKLSSNCNEGFFEKVFKDVKTDVNMATGALSMIMPGIVKTPVRLVGTIWDVIKGKVGDKGPDPLLIRFMNKKVKVVTFKVDSNINACEIVDLGGHEWPNLKPFEIDGTKLKKYLEIALKNAENTEQYQDSLNKIVRESKTSLAKIEKLSKSVEDKGIAMVVNILGRLSTSIIIEMTNNYMDYNKGIVKLGSMLLSGSADNQKELDEAEKKKKEEEKKKEKEENK